MLTVPAAFIWIDPIRNRRLGRREMSRSSRIARLFVASAVAGALLLL